MQATTKAVLTVSAAITDYEAHLAAWEATRVDGHLPEGSPEDKAAWAAEMRLIAFPCHSYEQVLTKVEYLFHAATPAAEGARTTAQTACFHAFLGSLIGIEEAGR